MADGETDTIPPDKQGSSLPVASVTINQFIQLVNQNSNLPDAATLDGYSNEDKLWIKQRVEVEQENRHQLLRILIERDHAMNLANNENAHRNERHRQMGVIAIILFSVLTTAVLLYLHVGVIALGILAVLLVSSAATAIGDQVLKRIKGDKISEGSPSSDS